MSFTVTVSATNGQDDVVLKVWVVTGGTETGGNSACVVTSFAAGPFSFTPNASGSVIVAAVNNDQAGNTAQTPGTNNTTDDSTNTAHAGNVWDGHYSGTVTGGTPVSVGTTFGASGSYGYGIYEVEKSGTIAIDASTPAAADGSTSSATTASFTPPAGAVLVAIATAVGNNTQVFSISDTSGLGLTWTQHGATATGGFTGSAAVYTTTIPGGGGGSAAPPVLPARPGKTWQRRYHHRQHPQLPPLAAPAVNAAAAPAAVTAAAAPPAAAVTVNAGVAAVAAAAPGATQGVYRLWPSTNGPSTATSYTLGNPFISGTCFAVKGGGVWFEGYWWWVCASGGQSTSAVKCALWTATSNVAGQVVPGSVVTSGALSAGWNYIPLSTPVQLAPSYDSNDSVNGSAYIAAIGCNGPFPDTSGYWGSSGAGVNGITNGPLVAYSGIGAGGGTLDPPWSLPQGVFADGAGQTDPSTTMPVQQSVVDNFWVDVQVSTTTPGGYSGSYRLWPDKADANPATTGDAAFNYTVATEISLSATCALDNIWYYSPPSATTLATRCDVWDISTGLSVASITSPSWLTASGSSYTAGGGAWISAAFAGGTTLPAGDYRVSVYNSNGTSDANWSPKDAVSDYWNETSSGAGAGGITWGPLYAPDWPNASAGYLYGGPSTATPPYSNGTAAHAQSVFGQTGSGVIEFPNLFAPVGASSNQTQNYWVDLEVTPAASGTAATIAAVVSVTAPAPTVAVTANAGVAAVAAAVAAPATAETVTAGVGIVLAADPGAMVSASGSTTATAGVAAVSVVANAASVAEGATAGAATVLAAAPASTVAEGITAGAGTVLAAVAQASIAETVTAGVGIIDVIATQATVNTSGSTNANAGVAAVSAVVVAPTTAVTLTAGAAQAQALVSAPVAAPAALAGVGTVLVAGTAATVSTVGGTVANAGAAAVASVARPVSSLALTATAQAASVLAAGVQVRPPLVAARSVATVTVTDMSTATVSGATSIATITDPRDGTAGVT